MHALMRRRSLGGPIILIGVGVLFLLRNLHRIALNDLGFYFAKWWPLLIILWGLISLVEHYMAKREGVPAPHLGFGGVVMIVLLIVAGMAATGISRAHLQMMHDWDGNETRWFWGGQTYNFGPSEMTQELPPGANIRVVDDRGDVTVNSWDNPQIKIVYSKQITASSQETANHVDEMTKPSIAVTGTTVLINANTAQAGDNKVETGIQLFAPRNAELQVDTRHGDITINNRNGNLRVNDQHGDISINEITGNVSVALEHGDLKLNDIKGDLSIDGRLNDVAVSNVSGTVTFNGDYFGDVTVSKAEKGVIFHTSRTEMEMGRLDGEMSMESGEMSATKFDGPIKLVTRSKDINLQDFSGDVHLENTNGSINLQSNRLPLGNIDIQNRKGDVQLSIPSGANFRLDAQTRSGDIDSDFSGLSVNSAKHESHASGNVGQGGPTVKINAEYGNVEIHKAG